MFHSDIKRVYITHDEVKQLSPGDLWDTDSGMGGSFTVKFISKKEDKYNFKNTHKEWKGYDFEFDDNNITQKIYKLMPA